eukprot:GHVP01040221.1.p1 GENE.GHVP01040221.1~~GHVP01040221.1.p1  ORF type:complete len:412 (+),score=84.48 GHVP01040221.1:27-1238(+)
MTKSTKIATIFATEVVTFINHQFNEAGQLPSVPAFHATEVSAACIVRDCCCDSNKAPTYTSAAKLSTIQIPEDAKPAEGRISVMSFTPQTKDKSATADNQTPVESEKFLLVQPSKAFKVKKVEKDKTINVEIKYFIIDGNNGNDEPHIRLATKSGFFDMESTLSPEQAYKILTQANSSEDEDVKSLVKKRDETNVYVDNIFNRVVEGPNFKYLGNIFTAEKVFKLRPPKKEESVPEAQPEKNEPPTSEATTGPTSEATTRPLSGSAGSKDEDLPTSEGEETEVRVKEPEDGSAGSDRNEKMPKEVETGAAKSTDDVQEGKAPEGQTTSPATDAGKEEEKKTENHTYQNAGLVVLSVAVASAVVGWMLSGEDAPPQVISAAVPEKKRKKRRKSSSSSSKVKVGA